MFDLFGTKKEGPGVYLDTPRKKGPARFFEILFRDFSSFYFSAFLSTIVLLPALFSLVFTVLSANLFWSVLFGAISGMIASPCHAVLVDTILRAQRDEPGYWWVRYRKAFRNNWKASLLPGAIFGMLINIQTLCLYVVLPNDLSVITLASTILSAFVTGFLMLWVYPQIVLFDMPLIKILRNAAILSFSQLPRTFCAVLLTLIYWAAVYLFFPISVLVLLLTLTWLPTFIGLSVIYLPLDKTFEVEKQVEEKREEEAAKQPRYYSKENNF
ncbi:MAG: hypothetical protein R3Y06_09480 [Faecalibacterium sp.]